MEFPEYAKSANLRRFPCIPLSYGPVDCFVVAMRFQNQPRWRQLQMIHCKIMNNI